jgi:hypothetical protein
VADQTRRQIIAGLGALCIPGAEQILNTNGAVRNHAGDLRESGDLRDRLAGVLGLMPPRPQANFKTLESVKLPSGWRYKIEYLAEAADPVFSTPADTIRAYFLSPTTKPANDSRP